MRTAQIQFLVAQVPLVRLSSHFVLAIENREQTPPRERGAWQARGYRRAVWGVTPAEAAALEAKPTSVVVEEVQVGRKGQAGKGGNANGGTGSGGGGGGGAGGGSAGKDAPSTTVAGGGPGGDGGGGTAGTVGSGGGGGGSDASATAAGAGSTASTTPLWVDTSTGFIAGPGGGGGGTVAQLVEREVFTVAEAVVPRVREAQENRGSLSSRITSHRGG